MDEKMENGFGYYGRAESIHAHLMRLERTYSYIFKEQALESDPSLTTLRPSPKKRKRVKLIQSLKTREHLLFKFCTFFNAKVYHKKTAESQ